MREPFSISNPRPVPVAWVDKLPNRPAEPTPQTCPFCGPHCYGVKWIGEMSYYWVLCHRPGCHARGPKKPTRLEAIQAWNSIRVGKTDKHVVFYPQPYESCKQMSDEKVVFPDHIIVE